MWRLGEVGSEPEPPPVIAICLRGYERAAQTSSFTVPVKLTRLD
jgi:hypothetical protein